MNKILFSTAALALSLAAGGAYAQPSQAQGGGSTAPTSNPPAASDATRPGTTGGAMMNSGMSGPVRAGSTGSTNTTATNPAGPNTANNPSSTSGAAGTNNR